MLRLEKHTGFTIVELLIVIVVIAILAAITIISYNGIQQRSIASALQSELSQVVKKVENYKTTNDSNLYPVDLATAGANASSTGTLSYYFSSDSNSFCAQNTKGSTTYSITSISKKTTVGNCTETNLLGWWKLNGNGTDAGPNAYDGTLAGTSNATGENGISTNALTFSSANESVVTMSDSRTAFNNAQTFSFWTRPTDWSSTTASTFISKRDTINNGFFIAYLTSFQAISIDCGGSGQRFNTGYAPPLNQWTHIMLTCPNEGRPTLYVNGNVAAIGATVDKSNFGNVTSNLRIGRDAQSGYLQNGSIDDVRIYDRLLSRGEAQLLYANHAQ